MNCFRNKKSLICLLLVSLALIFGGCTTDSLDIAPNGDSRLRTLGVEGANLIPSYNSYITDYLVMKEDLSSVKMVVAPYVFSTKFTINSSIFRMDTNRYGFAIYTEMKDFLATTNKIVINTVAADGLARAYTVTFLGIENSPGIKSLGTSSGVLYPLFSDGSAPSYAVATSTGVTNVYHVEAATTSFNLQLSKQHAGATTTINGTAVGAGVTDFTYSVTVPGGGATNTYVITNISQTGKFTNVKTVKAYYVAPANDMKLLDIKFANSSTGANIPFLPRFDHSVKTYPLTLVDVNTINFTITKSHSSQTVTVYKGSTQVTAGVVDGGGTVTVTGLTVEMGDEIRLVVAPTGGGSVEYKFNATLFTKETYGFNGNIGELYTVIDQLKEWDNSGSTPTHPSQPDIYITGIVTYDYGNNSSYYIEDGSYGVFVWTYWSKPSNLKIGQKVRVQVQGAKYWFGFAEVTRVPQTGGVTVLDGGKQYPLHYVDAQTVNVNTMNAARTTLRHGARLFKYTTKVNEPVLSDFDDSGWGNFDNTVRYKVTNPGRLTLGELSRLTYPVLDYIKKDIYGTFFGPLYYSSSDGAALEVSTLNYVSIP